MSKLSTGGKVTVTGAALLFLSLFAPWFDFDAGAAFGVEIARNGWQAGFVTGLLPMLLAANLAVGALLPLYSPQTELPKVSPWTSTVLGGVVAALVTARAVLGVGDLTRAWGMYVAVAAGLLVFAGGYISTREAEPRR